MRKLDTKYFEMLEKREKKDYLAAKKEKAR